MRLLCRLERQVPVAWYKGRQSCQLYGTAAVDCHYIYDFIWSKLQRLLFDFI